VGKNYRAQIVILFSPKFLCTKLTRRYRYFDKLVGLVRSDDSESYAGVSVANGRVSHAREVKGDDPDKKEYRGPPGLGAGRGATNLTHKSTCSVEKLLKYEETTVQQGL
jgi:hypothetical protein